MDTLGKQLFDMVQKQFGFTIKDRFYVVAETKLYRKGEDKELWAQDKTGKHTYQTFFDGEFLCFITNTMTPKDAYLAVMKALLKAYQDKKIYWNTFLYEVDQKKKKEEEVKKDNELEDVGKKAKTKEEKLVHEAFKRIRKEKKSPKLKVASIADIQKYG